MDTLEIFARTYLIAARLPEPLPAHHRAQTDVVPSLTIAAHRVVTAIAAAARRVRCQFQSWQVRRATFRTLWALDDRMLSDIGLPRSEIDSLARSVTNRDRELCTGEAVRSVAIDVTTKAANRASANDNDTELAA